MVHFLHRSSQRPVYCIFTPRYYLLGFVPVSTYIFYFYPRTFSFIFNGKGYYVFHNARQTLVPRFGLAHQWRLYQPTTLLYKVSKYKYTFMWPARTTARLLDSLLSLRPRNVFTGRGGRTLRSRYFSKPNKNMS